MAVTQEKLAELRDKKTLLNNVYWKADKDFGDKQLFFPYLSIDFVKNRLIEVLGSENLQFMLEKDEEFYAKGSIGVLMESGEWNFYSAIGVEKEGKGLTGEKLNKVKFKGNVSDTIKSCAEWLGLSVPIGITQKTLAKSGDFVLDSAGKKIANVKYEQQKINNYLNGLSETRYLIAKIYDINKEKMTPAIETTLKNLLNDLK